MSSPEARFERQLQSCLSTVRQWEIPESKAKALTKVPLDDLQAIASAKYDSLPSSAAGSADNREGVIQDLLLLELVEWFKSEFFTWTNSPNCPKCQSATAFVEQTTPTQLEVMHNADRVELYRCQKQGCQATARFPRFNNPAVLLDTRTGRCGEWANCFGLICRAIGYETRYVLDFTDHVWVEVFSAGMTPKNRWLHCDPCENKCDNPLMYEAGWGKKLTFVVAASIDDVQDVTWRYTHSNNLKQVLARRNCNEKRIVEIIVNTRKIIQSHLPASRKSLLVKRLMQELAEFMSPTGAVKQTEMEGRESGSLVWRLARQEIRDEPVAAKDYEWEIVHPSEDAPRQFVLTYDPVSDIYVSNLSPQTLRGWQNGVFKAVNISRKKERDWKMVYLARQENGLSEIGKISWKFNVPESAIKFIRIGKINLELETKTFHESAKIKVRVVSDSNSEIIVPETACVEGHWRWDTLHCAGSRSFLLECELSGGSGDVAWQQAQLFRTTTAGPSDAFLNNPLFRINIEFQ